MNNYSQYKSWQEQDGELVPQEIWKDIEGYEGLYQVSTFGNVKRIGISSGTKGGLLKPCIRNGYWFVGLSKNNKSASYSLHRLIAKAFIPNPENKLTVNHIDGNRGNKNIENLEWATYSEQIIHANKIGLFKSIPPIGKGDKHTEETKRKITAAAIGRPQDNFKGTRFLLHIETGIFYTLRDACSLIGVDFKKMDHMVRTKSTLLKHKLILT